MKVLNKETMEYFYLKLQFLSEKKREKKKGKTEESLKIQ